MDNTVVEIILTRIDKMEEKIDRLLASDAKRTGISIAASFIFTVVFAIIIAIIEKH